jgi:hypothetical protein
MNIKILISILTGILWFSCGNQSELPGGGSGNSGAGGNSGNSGNDWLIPQDEVLDGGPGKDGIPEISDPEFISVDEVDYLDDDDLVIGFTDGTEFRAYPHAILDWHEIVNDDINGIKLAVTYCPLTGTGIGWDRVIKGEETTFGVSGLLYNSNLIPYDRLTDSNWCQISYQSVQGNLIGEFAKSHYLVETSWKTWKEQFPDSKVVSRNTGFSRNYGNYPYGDYKTNHDRLLFPVSPTNNRLPAKERVLAIVGSNVARVYTLNSFSQGTRVINGSFLGDDIVVVGNKEKNFIVAFKNDLNGESMSFTPAKEGDENVVFMDTRGNAYDLFGYVVRGPDEGSKLQNINAFMAYWFSIEPFYQGIELF